MGYRHSNTSNTFQRRDVSKYASGEVDSNLNDTLDIGFECCELEPNMKCIKARSKMFNQQWMSITRHWVYSSGSTIDGLRRSVLKMPNKIPVKEQLNKTTVRRFRRIFDAVCVPGNSAFHKRKNKTHIFATRPTCFNSSTSLDNVIAQHYRTTSQKVKRAPHQGLQGKGTGGPATNAGPSNDKKE
ncbi:hypothetical protein CAEBREN_01847 [Caenorhabditis brenneri]|uniref:Uncharacterized protein n=1 Tax=Caenorhabditis brenneri TaxID=135651 RepID=G0NDX2_CAEBE|nr:hypothetical protein CAEBREN_01847 [Caenorhabditis brenneri]